MRANMKLAAVCAMLLATLVPARPGHAQSASPLAARELTLTTVSPKARSLARKGWALHANGFHEADAVVALRKAIALDSGFAMAHQLLAVMHSQGAEQLMEQKKAYETRMHAGPNEQLLIEWQTSALDGHMIGAIEKLNELLAALPHDATVVFLASQWLADEGQFERSVSVYEHSGIAASPGLLDLAAYTYADLRQYDKAQAVVEKYVALMPKEANPLDTYGDVLRSSGQFEAALARYHAALALDPSFFGSQFGIANTYALMGDQARARQEYQTGFAKFKVPQGKLYLWRMNHAATYVREGDVDGADRAFQTVADSARVDQLSGSQADAYRQMSIYQRDPDKALALLGKAAAALDENRNVSKSQAALLAAKIMRAQIERLAEAGRMDRAQAALARLTQMADESRSAAIERERAGASGSVLFRQVKYDDAAAELLGDSHNPLSLSLLVEAYRRAGNADSANGAAAILLNTNELSVEQAAVVPAFRKSMCAPNCR